MSIQVKCPNGHLLTVKNKYAGMSGLCPHCRARVQVPQRLTDDHILDVVGDWQQPEPPKDREYAPPETGHDPDDDDDSASVLHGDCSPSEVQSGISVLGSSIIRHEKACPHCGHLVELQYASCPKCKEYFPD